MIGTMLTPVLIPAVGARVNAPLLDCGASLTKMWQCERITRLIDRALQEKLATLLGRDTGFVVHGNRYLAHVVFQRLSAQIVNATAPMPADAASTVGRHAEDVYQSIPHAFRDITGISLLGGGKVPRFFGENCHASET